MSTLCKECSFNTKDNETDILLAQVKRQVEKLMNDTTATLLKQNNKIAEVCVYIKENLSNEIRTLLDTMNSSGELDDIITTTILSEIELLQAKNETLISVKSFGATGDGCTDDTESFKSALESKYVTIYVPAGTYIVENISLPEGKILMGDGEVSVIKQKANSKLYANPVELTKNNVKIEKLVIDGNGDNQKLDTGKHGIYVLGSNVSIKDCTVQNVNGEGIMVGYTGYLAKNITIDNVIMRNNKRNELALLNCDSVNVLNSILSGDNTSALLDIEIHSSGDRVNNVIFMNCSFEEKGEAIKLLTNGYKTSFDSIIFENCNINASLNIANFENVSINNSILKKGIEVFNGKDITINGSTVSKTGGNGLYIYAEDGKVSENIRVINSDILNSNIGIIVQNTSNVYLSGNVIKGNNIGVGVYYKNNYTLLNSCFISGNDIGIKYVSTIYDNNYIDRCILNNGVDYEGLVKTKTFIDSFKDKLSLINSTYSVDMTLDENANLVVPTTMKADMVGIRKQTDVSTSWVQNGMIFEDKDGKLKYRNLSGSIQTLSN